MELKRCLFCGGTNTETLNALEEQPEMELVGLTSDNWNVLCNDCYAMGGTRRTAIEAEEAWNARAEQEQPHWIINGDWGECSHCHEASKLSVMDHKDYCPACGARMDGE